MKNRCRLENVPKRSFCMSFPMSSCQKSTHVGVDLWFRARPFMVHNWSLCDCASCCVISIHIMADIYTLCTNFFGKLVFCFSKLSATIIRPYPADEAPFFIWSPFLFIHVSWLILSGPYDGSDQLCCMVCYHSTKKNTGGWSRGGRIKDL